MACVACSIIDKKTGRFVIIWTTKKIIRRMSVRLTVNDATYKLTWCNFSVFIGGVTSPRGVFFQTHMSLVSHEDGESWAVLYPFLKSIIGNHLKYAMADGAQEITNAINKMEEKRIEKPEVLENQVACEICGNFLKRNSIKAHLKSTRCSNKIKAICQDEEVLSPTRAKRRLPA